MITPNRAKFLAVVAVVAATLLFAVNSGVSRILLWSGITPATLISFRLTITAMLMAGWAVLTSRRMLRPPSGRLMLVVVIHGIVGVAALQTLFLVAVDRITLGLALTVQYMAPILVALWVRHVQRIDLPRQVWLGLGLSLLGLAAVTRIWSGLTADPLGLLASIGAASCFATYFIVGEVAASVTDTLRLLIWSFAAGAVGLNIVAPAWNLLGHLGRQVTLQGRLDSLDVPLWAVVVWFVVLGTMVPYVMVLGSMRLLSATVVSSTHMLEPAAGFAIGWMWFAEAMSPIAVLGCAAVMAGVLLAQRGTQAVSGATANRWDAECRASGL
ncbi:EamA family transporter [Mycolicibacterium goodii]